MISANKSWNLYNRKRLLNALKGAGWTVIALASPDDLAEKIRDELDIEFIPLPMQGDSTKVSEDIRLFFQYLSIYRKRKPFAALHINNKPNIYGALAASLLRIPSISNIAGLGIIADKTGITPKIVFSLYRLALSFPKSYVFFQNRDDREFFLERHLVREEKTAVLPGSGIDVSAFTPDEEGNQSDRKGICFLFSSRLLVSKGIEQYIEAASQIKSEYPDTEFDVIGEYDSDNPIFISPEKLESARNTGLITYYGNVPDVKPFIRKADCVVLPSFYREGVPRVLLEGAAMGKPLIAADSVGTREPVEDGQNGFLVAPEDTGSLLEGMLRIIRASRSERSEMGRKSRHIAETRFSDTIILESYIGRLSLIKEGKLDRFQDYNGVL